MIRGVLFVCVGNLCRSPMAEGLLRQAMPSLPVASAGLAARAGLPPEPRAVAAMRRCGIDIAGLVSQPLRADLYARHDLVLTMDRGLREEILQRYPQLNGRVHVLGGEPIPDPYGGPDELFEACRQRIARAMQAWIPRLQRLTGIEARAPS